MTVQVNPTEVCEEIERQIRKGLLDEYLPDIVEAIGDRRVVLRRKAFRELKVGDRVRIGNIKPRYMSGLTAKVLRKRVSKVEIELDHEPPGNRFGKKLIVPAQCLEVLDGDK